MEEEEIERIYPQKGRVIEIIEHRMKSNGGMEFLVKWTRKERNGSIGKDQKFSKVDGDYGQYT